MKQLFYIVLMIAGVAALYEMHNRQVESAALEIPPVTSPNTAVRAAIAAKARTK